MKIAAHSLSTHLILEVLPAAAENAKLGSNVILRCDMIVVAALFYYPWKYGAGQQDINIVHWSNAACLQG